MEASNPTIIYKQTINPTNIDHQLISDYPPSAIIQQYGPNIKLQHFAI